MRNHSSPSKNGLLALVSLLFVLLLSSCSNELITMSPILTPKGEPVFFVPKRFKVNKDTRRSDLVRLSEDINGGVGKGALEAHLFPNGMQPDQGSMTTTLFLPAMITEKGQQRKVGAIIPLAVMKSVGIAQPQIDAALLVYQRAVYRELRKQGRVIPESRVKDAPKKPTKP